MSKRYLDTASFREYVMTKKAADKEYDKYMRTLFVHSTWAYNSETSQYDPSYYINYNDLNSILIDVVKEKQCDIRLAFESLANMSGSTIPQETGVVGHYEPGIILNYIDNGNSVTSLALIIRNTIDMSADSVYFYEGYATYNANTFTINGNSNIELYKVETGAGGGGGGAGYPATSEDIEMLMFNYEEQATNEAFYIETESGYGLVMTNFNDYYDRDQEQS